MEKLAPRISLGGWSLWFAVSLSMAVAHRTYPSDFSIRTALQWWTGFGLQGGGIILSLVLCQRPNRGLALLLAGLCFFVFLKFYLGEMLFQMLPSLGGLSFTAAVAEWWHRNTTSASRFLTVVPFALFVIASSAFWLFYGLFPANPDRVKTTNKNVTPEHSG